MCELRTPLAPIGSFIPEYFEPVFKRKWKEKDLYYTGDPKDYARLVFRRYGRDGKKPTKRGHLLILFVLGLALIGDFLIF